MAHFLEEECQGCYGSQNCSPKAYHVVMKLCDPCASAKVNSIQNSAHDNEMVLICPRHPGLKALYFCGGHCEVVCRMCLPSHTGCKLIDLKDEVEERRRHLAGLIERCSSKVEEIKEFRGEVDARSDEIESHFDEIEDEIRDVTAQDRRDVEEDRDQKIEEIKKVAEDSIHRINQKERGLIEKLDQIKAMFAKKLSEIKSYLQYSLAKVEQAKVIDDVSLLQSQFRRTMASLNSIMNRQMDTSGVDDLVDAAESVELIRGIDDRIHVPLEEWEAQHGSSKDTGLAKNSYMMCALSDSQVVLKNTDDGSVYVSDIENGDTKMAISGKTPYDIYSCASLQDGRLVCGTRFGEIVVYDQTWNPLRVIYLDGFGRSIKLRPVFVCIDPHGLILASSCKPTIHIFDPNTGEFERSIDVKVRSICELHSLPSGDVVLRTSTVDDHEDCTEVRILDASGCLRVVHQLRNKSVMSMAVDSARSRVFMILLGCEHDKSRDVGVVALTQSGFAELEVDSKLDSQSMKHVELCYMPGPDSLVIHHAGSITAYQKVEPGLEEIIANIH